MVHRRVLWLDPFMAELTDSAVTLKDLGKCDCRITCNPERLCSIPLAKADLTFSVSAPDALKASVNLATPLAISVISVFGRGGFVKVIFLVFMLHTSYALFHGLILFHSAAQNLPSYSLRSGPHIPPSARTS